MIRLFFRISLVGFAYLTDTGRPDSRRQLDLICKYVLVMDDTIRRREWIDIAGSKTYLSGNDNMLVETEP